MGVLDQNWRGSSPVPNLNSNPLMAEAHKYLTHFTWKTPCRYGEEFPMEMKRPMTTIYLSTCIKERLIIVTQPRVLEPFWDRFKQVLEEVKVLAKAN